MPFHEAGCLESVDGDDGDAWGLPQQASKFLLRVRCVCGEDREHRVVPAVESARREPVVGGGFKRGSYTSE
jgi:hypothetical protein